jgi:hypothetical protein
MNVHLIFKTHLDIGFTDYARSVTDGYFNVFIPKALDTARAMREQGKRFIWTTGSWLIYEYLEQASPENRKRMEDAIVAGDMVWHGLPFTTHTELMDVSLFRFGMSLSQTLDKRFGKKTIAAKMTDVPGHTRGIVPLMVEAGLRFLHIGVNPASTPPTVPPVFVWQDDSGARLLVMYQRGAYGAAVTVEGLDDAIAFAHTNDNMGPQTPDEVIHAYADLQKRFPDATIHASTMDAFAEPLLTVESQLPVITGEMGDTWIHGVGTDPKKVARYRALLRLRSKWLGDKIPAPDEPLHRFSRKLMLVPEHTWGMDEKIYFKDYVNYTPEQLSAIQTTEAYTKFAASWAEQRAYVDEAVAELANTPYAQEAKAALAELEPREPIGNPAHKTPHHVFKTPYFDIGFDERGVITRFIDIRAQRYWASPSLPFAWIRYQTFSHEDYERFYNQYIINKYTTREWSVDDYTKPGIEAINPPSRFWETDLKNFFVETYEGGQRFLLEMRMAQEAYTRWGCPKDFSLEIDLPDDQPELRFTLQWFHKPANRLPEALWFSFAPNIARNKKNTPMETWDFGWRMDKLGKQISTTEVIHDGNNKLHAVNKGIFYEEKDGTRLEIETLDAALVAPGEPSLLDFHSRPPAIRGGMHFNLYNNVWGTNFPMWYSDDARFRFILRF